MVYNFTSTLIGLVFLIISFTLTSLTVPVAATDAAVLGQNVQNGFKPEVPNRRLPILYEAYYPEPRRDISSLQEIERLRELTSQLLREEEQLEQLEQLAAAARPENVLQPRSQLLQYVFSGVKPPGPPPPVAAPFFPFAPPAPDTNDQVQVASLTISDIGQPTHKHRHHHGQANWLLRRLAASSAST